MPLAVAFVHSFGVVDGKPTWTNVKSNAWPLTLLACMRITLYRVGINAINTQHDKYDYFADFIY